jgi:hypothetical protein
MEGSPRFPNEAGSNNQPERKYRRRKRGNFRVPGIASVESEKRGNDVPPRIELERPKPDSLFAEKDNLDKESGHTDADDHNKDADKRKDGYESLPSHELHEGQLAGGEVIIQLDESGPVAEHIIPLHGERIDEEERQRHDRQYAATVLEHEPASHPETVPLVAAVPPFEPPIFRAQPEQQHMAHDQAPDSSPQPEMQPYFAAEASVAPVPPEVVAHSPEQAFTPLPTSELPSEPVAPAEAMLRRYPAETTSSEVTPEQLYISHMAPLPELPVRSVVPAADRLVTKRELDRATSRAEGSGLLVGLLAGGAYEHFKHKRRAKRREKQFQQQTKQLQKAREEYQFTATEQQRKQDITEARLHTAERQLHDQSIVAAAAEHQASSPSMPTSPAERFAAPAAAATYGAERPAPSAVGRPANVFERPLAPGNPGEQLPMPSRLAPELLQPTPEGQLEVPANHHIETSSWHSIEIDSRTGKPVENPAFQYGHEYHRERAQENAAVSQRTAAAGEVALVAAAIDENDSNKLRKPNGGGALSGGGSAVGLTNPSAIPSATTQGAPSSPVRNAAQPGVIPDTSRASSGKTDQPLWPWLVALAVVAICLIALL